MSDITQFKGRNGSLGNDGSNNRTAKLNEIQARDIKKRSRAGNESMAAIAREYGVATNTVKSIRDGFSWSQVKVDEEK